MFLKRFFQWLLGLGGETSRASSAGQPPSPKSYGERYAETDGQWDEEVKQTIASREAEEKPCGVAYRVLADRSDARAKANSIDPPRPGRKTYAERHGETSAMDTEHIKEMIREREAQGKECGVLYRVLSERS